MFNVALSRGRGSKLPNRMNLAHPYRVALSRGRGSKHGKRCRHGDGKRRSPSHEGVDRNSSARSMRSERDGRPLTRAWIETTMRAMLASSWSESPSHEGVDRNWDLASTKQVPGKVALSRGRGSKLLDLNHATSLMGSRPLTRAWIETRAVGVVKMAQESPSHEGVDRNRENNLTLTRQMEVALSRGRGSKPCRSYLLILYSGSPSHEGVDRNSAAASRDRRFVESPSHEGVDRN